MKKLLLALALALGTLPAIATSAADAIPKHLDATLPDDIRYAHQAAQMETIAYKPVKDGYYRKELGKTADVRLVVQHFYQNSDKPASAPFLLKKTPRRIAAWKMPTAKSCNTKKTAASSPSKPAATARRQGGRITTKTAACSRKPHYQRA